MAAAHERNRQLSKREQQQKLRTFDDLVPKIPTRPAKEVEKEIEELRSARPTGGRRTPVNKK